MFGRLFELIENVKSLDVDKIAVSIYYDKDIQKFILRANRIDQLSQGINADNELIGTYSIYTDIMNDGRRFTFEDKTFEKIANRPYNFVDTGEFFRSFEVVVYADGFTILADDRKGSDSLTDKFGNILGLTQENINELAQEIIPLFIDKLRGQILR